MTPTNYTLFPLRLILETADALKANGATFARYADFASAAGCRKRLDYLREFSGWQSGGSSWLGFGWWLGTRFIRRRLARRGLIVSAAPAGKPVVIFQHDADRHPNNTLRVMGLEQEKGIVSSSYFFRRRCARWPGDEEPYDLDLPAMQELERAGFEIGYHQNAYEQANYDLPEAWRIAREDVAFFRQHFNLRSFVPHGGRRGPNGENNHRLPHDGCLSGLLLAFNSRGIASDFKWSDGHAEHPHECQLRDPRALAREVRGRVRAIFLFHPQYYGDELRPDWAELAIAKLPWWRQLWRLD